VTSAADENGSTEAPPTPPADAGEPQENPAAPQPEGDESVTVEEADVETELARTRSALAELTGDLQRLQAEYLNYKRRVDRDRELVRQNATFAVLGPIIDVLDTIDRAREHDELHGGFKAVAEQLERAVSSMGLTRFGEPGDAFDPTLHDALSHMGTSPDVDVVTCRHIVKSGYRFGDRVVRAAQVVVVDPEGTPADSAEQEATGDPAPAPEDTDVAAE